MTVLNIGSCDLRLRPLPYHVQFSLETILVHARSATHENLLDVRLRSSRHAPDCVSIYGRVAPAEHRQTFFSDDAFEDSLALQALMFLNWQKCHAHGVLARYWKVYV